MREKPVPLHAFINSTDDKTNVHYDEHGLLHAIDKPAMITNNGTEYWYIHGKQHRVGGPVVKSKELEIWAINGKYHRIDGPAYRTGPRRFWFFNGHQVTGQVSLILSAFDIDADNLSDDDKLMIPIILSDLITRMGIP